MDNDIHLFNPWVWLA